MSNKSAAVAGEKNAVAYVCNINKHQCNKKPDYKLSEFNNNKSAVHTVTPLAGIIGFTKSIYKCKEIITFIKICCIIFHYVV